MVLAAPALAGVSVYRPMDPVSHLRRKVLPILQAYAQQLRAEHPDLNINVYDWSVGDRTDWQGHAIGLECLIGDAMPELPDNVALAVELCHLHKTPKISSADVTWGHPSGHIEAELLADPIRFSPESLTEIVDRLPELFIALQQAVRRGQPPAK